MSKDGASPLKESPADSFYDMLLNNLQEGINLLDPNLRVLYANPASLQLTGHSLTEVLGKPCMKNVLLDLNVSEIRPCRSSCPVSQVLKDGKVQDLEAYLHHKEGYRFPVQMRIIPIRNQKGEIIAALETFQEKSPKLSVPHRGEILHRMGLLDPLTSLGNRRYLEMHVSSRLDEMKRYRMSFGVLFITIDRFEDITDAYGNVVGDKVIKMVSRTITNNIRFFEVVGRWNVSELLTVLLNVNVDRMDMIANKLRLLVEKSTLREDEALIRSTVSIGASLAQITDTTMSLVERARKLAEHAQWLGTNKVCLKLEP